MIWKSAKFEIKSKKFIIFLFFFRIIFIIIFTIFFNDVNNIYT
jgi:hypothetical protein